jgi:hypothetical protein
MAAFRIEPKSVDVVVLISPPCFLPKLLRR